MSERPLIQVILGSTRPGRFSEKAGAWVMDRLGSRDDMELELLDLRDFPMPFYEHERPPAYGHREYAPEVERWARAIERGDGYIVVSPEYNHGYPAVLKNALDNVFPSSTASRSPSSATATAAAPARSSSCAWSPSSSRWRPCATPSTSCPP
jgi:NAD(P)H-dependent FMN reductase